METINYLLKFLFKLAVAVIFISFVWWLLTALYPSLKLRNIFASSNDQGWLPAPGSVGSLLGQQKVPDENDNVYVPGPAYSGYGSAYNNNNGGAVVDFISYTTKGEQVTHYGSPTSAQASTGGTSQPNYSNTSRSLYVRNLSIFEGGSIYTGITFVGEARNTMFQNGRFPIIILDNTGRIATIATAEATSNWSIPGWARFQVRVNGVLPVRTPCTMIFQAGQTNTTTQPVHVSMPITCN